MLLNTFLSSLIGRVSVANWVVRILQRDAELMRAVVALIFGIGNVPKRTAWRMLRASWKR
jgi:hypothetical protein